MEKEMMGHTFKYENDCLYRKHKRYIGKWICYNHNKPTSHGYIAVCISPKHYYLHRLIYKFHNDEWDITDNCSDNSIDHINQDKQDNRIENLRVVNYSQNQQNRTHRNGKVITGVCFRKERNKPWVASWNENYRSSSKCFATEDEALAYRAEMVKQHYTHDPIKSSFCV